MKERAKRFLQTILGFELYLKVFSVVKILTLHRDSKEGDFLYFSNLLQGDGLILDIGANIGVMSVLLARQHPNSVIYAFEPIPHNYRVMEYVFRLFRLTNICIRNTALSNRIGTSEMVMPEINQVKMQGLAHMVEIPESKPVGEYFQVSVTQLDAISEFDQSERPVLGIKIDVENHEYQVLRGAEKVLAKHKPLVYCELWDNDNRARCLSLMQQYDYVAHVLQKGRLTPFEAQIHTTQNFFFVPNKKSQ